MKNLFVTHKIALLAKEKGYKELAMACYDGCDMLSTYSDIFNPKNYNVGGGRAKSAPIYQELIDWFIEKHNIHPSYGSNHSGWYWEITKTNGTSIISQSDYKYFDNHYDALNQAIEEAFKLI